MQTRYLKYILIAAAMAFGPACDNLGDAWEKVKAAEGDTTALTLTSMTPADGATGVASGVVLTVILNFSEAISTSSILLNSTDSNCTGTVQISADNFATCGSWGSTSATFSNDNATASMTTAATMDPCAGTSQSGDYKIKITTAVTDTSGNALASEIITSFQVGTGC